MARFLADAFRCSADSKAFCILSTTFLPPLALSATITCVDPGGGCDTLGLKVQPGGFCFRFSSSFWRVANERRYMASVRDSDLPALDADCVARDGVFGFDCAARNGVFGFDFGVVVR